MRPLCLPTLLQRAGGRTRSTSGSCSVGHARATLGRGGRPAAAWLAAPSDERTGEGHMLCFCVEEQQSPWKGVPPALCSIPEGLRQPTALSSTHISKSLHIMSKEKKKKEKGGGIRLRSCHNCNYYPREMARQHFEAKYPLG